ncbi:hypothetical protein HZ326_18040 [Fusarium oxysporum f. sp. albedinis]|nr:hypothetical protein HZ326_18040 [Fusarium oxysporum f. sp. albedinis]
MARHTRVVVYRRARVRANWRISYQVRRLRAGRDGLAVLLKSISMPPASGLTTKSALTIPMCSKRANRTCIEASGNWHAISLTEHPLSVRIFTPLTEAFERMSRESASELKGALEKLKHS